MGLSFVLSGDSCSIGSGPSADLQVFEPSVAPLHARVRSLQGAHYLSDAGSASGTYARGVRLGAGQEIPLADGELFQLGAVSIAYTRAPTMDRLAAFRPMAKLSVTSGVGVGASASFSERALVGSAENTQLRLAGAASLELEVVCHQGAVFRARFVGRAHLQERGAAGHRLGKAVGRRADADFNGRHAALRGAMNSAADQQLKESVEREVLACIGCNDCLLACPIVESRHVTIAELNNSVHLPMLNDANVARFVTACTQCRQCVPACPADLNRADMVLFNKLKIEDSVPDHELTLQARTVAFASGMTLDGLSQKLGELQLFRGGEPGSSQAPGAQVDAAHARAGRRAV